MQWKKEGGFPDDNDEGPCLWLRQGWSFLDVAST